MEYLIKIVTFNRIFNSGMMIVIIISIGIATAVIVAFEIRALAKAGYFSSKRQIKNKYKKTDR